VPTKDAKVPYCLLVAAKNVTGGKTRDPDHCALQQAAIDDPDVLHARIGANVAFLIFAKNPKVAIRYVLGQRAKRMIEAFDEIPEKVRAIATWADGAEVVLDPPPPSRRKGTRVNGKTHAHPGTGKSPLRRAPLRHL
jgi:hypothetical protein